MDMDKATQEKIQELQALEQNMHSILSQKQAFQLELNESANALEEIKDTDGEVYKVTGGVMLKIKKDKALNELEEKKKLIELRLQALDKQEKLLESKTNELRDETQKAFQQAQSKN